MNRSLTGAGVLTALASIGSPIPRLRERITEAGTVTKSLCTRSAFVSPPPANARNSVKYA
jgi:hypothetical protein